MLHQDISLLWKFICFKNCTVLQFDSMENWKSRFTRYLEFCLYMLSFIYYFYLVICLTVSVFNYAGRKYVKLCHINHILVITSYVSFFLHLIDNKYWKGLNFDCVLRNIHLFTYWKRFSWKTSEKLVRL